MDLNQCKYNCIAAMLNSKNIQSILKASKIIIKNHAVVAVSPPALQNEDSKLILH